MHTLRRIKRYATRRFYDLKEQRYVTLDEIQQLLKEGADILVEEHATQRDITMRILLQLVLDIQQARAEPVLKPEILLRIIRSE